MFVVVVDGCVVELVATSVVIAAEVEGGVVGGCVVTVDSFVLKIEKILLVN